MTHLQRVPAHKIVRAIAGAAERWSDGDFPPRVRILDRIAGRTGYSLPVVEYALDHVFMPITERALQAVIRSELGALEALDGFAERAGRPPAYAAPAGRVCIISSRTTIGVAIPAAIFALCAKCDVSVKDREDSLVSAFFETLCEELDEFRDAARAAQWISAEEAHQADLREAEVVVAFGSDDTLAAIKQLTRAQSRFIGFGSRASAGIVTREALTDAARARAVAQGAARDLVLYESQGCLSLHVLFVETGAAIGPRDFSDILARAVADAAVEFPLSEQRDPQLAARVAMHRELAAFRSASGKGMLFADPAGSYAVLFDPPTGEPPAFLPRTLGVLPISSPPQAAQYVREHCLPLEAFALSNDRPDVVQAALDSGAVRLAKFGELQQPAFAGNHGGRPRIAEFVRWIDSSL